MASITRYVAFRDTPRPDGLCPKCSNPALKTYHLEKFAIEGITILGTRTMCTDCRIWITPLQEYDPA